MFRNIVDSLAEAYGERTRPQTKKMARKELRQKKVYGKMAPYDTGKKDQRRTANAYGGVDKTDLRSREQKAYGGSALKKGSLGRMDLHRKSRERGWVNDSVERFEFTPLIEEVRSIIGDAFVEGNRRPGRKTRSDRRQDKLGKRYAGLIKTAGDDYSAGAEGTFGRAIARDVAISKKSGRTALKGSEAARLRKRRDAQESIFWEADDAAHQARKAEIMRKAQDRRNVQAGKPTSDDVAKAKAAAFKARKAENSKLNRASSRKRRSQCACGEKFRHGIRVCSSCGPA